MDRRETIIGIIWVLTMAILLTFGNAIMEVVFRAIGV